MNDFKDDISMDCIELTKKLVNFSSVTPLSLGCIEYIAQFLENLGFEAHVVKFGSGAKEVTNLYAVYRNGGKNICFAGHIDVVPTGPVENWQHAPFEAKIADGKLYGRGTVDMKGAIAAMLSCVQEVIFALKQDNKPGSISFLLTSDEEGDAIYGLDPMVKWLEEKGEKLDFCIIGEPTYHESFGDVLQIGRRGSVTFQLEIFGTQGHAAYEDYLDTPSVTIKILNDLINLSLDDGDEVFVASKLKIISLDIPYIASNVIPGKATISLNIRYNNLQSSDKLQQICENIIQKYHNNFTLTKLYDNVLPFVCDKNISYIQDFAQIVTKEIGQMPKFLTSGGASDGRFIVKLCPVLEFGLANNMAHKIDEYLLIEDLQKLARIYRNFLLQCFSAR